MHDIDRTQLQPGMRLGEQEVGYQEFESELFESELLESEGEGEAESEIYYEDEEYEGETYEGEGEAYEDEGEMYETEAEQFYEYEAWEMEMAAELLAVRDEAELEQFLGNFVSSAAKGLSSLAKKAAPVLLPALKTVAKQALPIAGGALGGFVGGPIGAQIGSQLASTAGDMFGLELEGLSYEDQEFEVAKQFVRFANDAVTNLGETAHHYSDPKRAAHAAVSASAHQNAPGLHSSSPSHQGGRAPHPGGAPASHRNGVGASPHPGAPRPSHPAGPRPSHPGAPRPSHPGAPQPPQQAGPRPSHPGAPRPPQQTGPRPSHPGAPQPPQQAGPRPSHPGAPQPPQQAGPQPSPGIPMAGRGPILSPGGPAPVATAAAGSSTNIPGAPGRSRHRPGRLTVDGLFGYGPSSAPGVSGQVRSADGIDQGAPAGVQGGGRGKTGRWYRRGNRIVLIGV
jgi:hypothetical protein